MLNDYLGQVICAGGDALEIEYKDAKEWLTAFNGSFGIGLGCLTSIEAKPLFAEMAVLKKTRRIIVDGRTYRLRFAKRESFGEWVHRIEIHRDKE